MEQSEKASTPLGGVWRRTSKTERVDDSRVAGDSWAVCSRLDRGGGGRRTFTVSFHSIPSSSSSPSSLATEQHAR